MRTFWKWSSPDLSPALYFRTIGDIWEKAYNFVLPLKDGRPMKISIPRVAGHYITKYLSKEHKEWHHRMKATRNLGMKTLKAETEGFNAIVKELEGDERAIFISDYAQRMSNETEMTELQVIDQKLKIQSQQIDIDIKNKQKGLLDIQRQADQIRLMYQEIEQILNVAKTYEDIRSTQIGTAISAEEWKYMSQHKRKMATDRVISGIIAELVGGPKEAKGKLSSGVDWLMMGIRQAIVRRSAYGKGGFLSNQKIGATARGFGITK